MPLDCEIRQAYATLIQRFPWDFYVTQTYRVRHNDGLRASLRLADILQSKFNATRLFIASESHSLGGVHLHALTRHTFDPDLNPERIWKYLFKANGRATVARPRYNSQALVTWYCSKYVTKGDCDFYFYGDKEAWIFDQTIDKNAE